jgi:hypothetical protein
MSFKYTHGGLKTFLFWFLQGYVIFNINFLFRMDATLRELSGLVKDVNPDAKKKGTTLHFALITPEPGRPTNLRARDLGATISGHKGPDDSKTLAQLKYVFHAYFIFIPLSFGAFSGV